MSEVSRRRFLGMSGFGVATAVLGRNAWSASRPRRNVPNILWISTEDINCNLGCYGDKNAVTPVLDGLAKQGVRYTRAFTTAGVCAPVRTCIITGMYATTTGMQHMRAGGSGVEKNIRPNIPKGIRCFPEYLRDAGYYCANNAKQDYQFITPPTVWDDSSKTAHWRNRKPGQPFFFVRNLEITHESKINLSPQKHAAATARLTPDQRQDPAKQELPPYYPDTLPARQDWANYLELITAMDYQAGDLLKQLEEDGLEDDTIVFFWSDHGVGLPRAKRWLYDSGTHIPLIVRIPEKFRVDGQGVPGTVDGQLVSSIDFGPTVLNLAGIPIPDYMQGRPFLGKHLPPERQYIYGARDRMDERYDIIRSVRDKRYRYIRNYEPFKPYYQYMNTPEKGTTMRELRRLHALGQLPPAAEQFMADHKPPEELYDLVNDPYEVHNLAASPEYKSVLERMRKAHVAWVARTRDLGLLPESDMVARAQIYGDRYAISKQPGSAKLFERISRIAAVAGEASPADQGKLEKALDDPDAAIRYWGAVGLGNIGKPAASSENRIKMLLNDSSPVVRIAAARALCRMDNPKKAIPTLVKELKNEHQWVRLEAATVLDNIGDMARPAIPAMKEALGDKENKYVVRMVNHTLNVLLGTHNSVR
ncbi:MAG: sulfatase-like hydrolase/transferase [Candidatus Hydrogenedentes bacterium]|nr:sulfatase-like hydrolase/transferase [Candidatus Hydrogenedentota bacterium]